MHRLVDRVTARLKELPGYRKPKSVTERQTEDMEAKAWLQRLGLLAGSTPVALTPAGVIRDSELLAMASAITAQAGQLTFDDVEDALREALCESLGVYDASGQAINSCPWLEDVLYLDRFVIYRYQEQSWKAPFVLNADGTATVGLGIPVVQVWVEAEHEHYWRSDDGQQHAVSIPVCAAEWTRAYMNDLPDSAFLYVEPGGTKDADGRTTPRTLRHFPYKDSSGVVDLPHLRNALARIPQSALPQAVKDRVAKKAQRIAKANGIGSTTASAPPSSDQPESGTLNTSDFLRVPLVSRSGRTGLTQVPIAASRGVYALMDGPTRVEMWFDTRAPHAWTLPDAKKWLSRPFICASAKQAEVVAESATLPAPVAQAIATLKAAVPPLSPFIIRVKGSIGKFEAQSGKVNFTADFYRKFGATFVGKPYYLGHIGHDSADYRDKIGQILHFEFPDGGEPHWYINVSEGQDALRKLILEEQALAVSAERTGASSIEGWASQTEDRDGDGYLEPTGFHASGIAMVRREAATGTRIDQVIH